MVKNNFLLSFRRLQVFLILLLAAPLAASGAEAPLTAVIRAVEEVVLRSEQPGVVQRIAVQEGERVREGQLLVELKNERQKIGLDLSRARLAKAAASLSETKILLENGQKEVERVKIAADALPRKEREDREDQVLRLQALLEAQQAEHAQTKEEVRLRENELKETQLIAPFAGTVTQIVINRGDTLKPTETPVLELVALDRLFAEVSVSAVHVHEVKVGQKVRVQVDNDTAGRQTVVEGRLIHVNPKLDASSRTFKVKIGFSDANGRVRPGMYAQVNFGFGAK